VLKNEASERTQWSSSREQSRGRYASVTVVDGMPLGAGVDIKTPRASFAELPRRGIHLYASVVDWRTGHSGPTVYYLGVPETTPEFTTEAALETYLARPRSPGR